MFTAELRNYTLHLVFLVKLQSALILLGSYFYSLELFTENVQTQGMHGGTMLALKYKPSTFHCRIFIIYYIDISEEISVFSAVNKRADIMSAVLLFYYVYVSSL